MSKHIIHGLTLNVSVCQGDLTEIARGRCVGKIVNLCREMDGEEFKSAMADARSSAYVALLGKLDSALADGYTKRYSDEFAPIASLSI